MGNKPADEQDT